MLGVVCVVCVCVVVSVVCAGVCVLLFPLFVPCWSLFGLLCSVARLSPPSFCCVGGYVCVLACLFLGFVGLLCDVIDLMWFVFVGVFALCVEWFCFDLFVLWCAWFKVFCFCWCVCPLL